MVDLLPLSLGLFDPVAGEAEAVADGVATAPFDTHLAAWTERVRGRFGIDPATVARPGHSGRTVRSPDFAPLLERMREVFALDPSAIW